MSGNIMQYDNKYHFVRKMRWLGTCSGRA